MARLPKVRLRAIPVFPSNVSSGVGIDVAKMNGAYTIDLDVADFIKTAVPSGEETTTYAIAFGSVTDDNPDGSYSLVPFAGYQITSAELTSLSGLSTTGLIARTGSATHATRTITGTANEITVTNGSGVSGDPTLSLPSAMTLTGKTLTGGTFTGPTINGGTISSLSSMTIANAGFSIYDTDASNVLTLKPGSNLTANRILTITTGDAARTIDVSGGNLVLGGTFTTSANSITLTASGTTNITLPTTGTLATLAGSETLTNKTLTSPTINGGTLGSISSISVANTGFGIYDTDASHVLSLVPGSNLTAARTLTLTTGDASRTIDVSGGNLTLGGTFTTGGGAITLNASGTTNITIPTTGTLATLAGSETLSNKTLVAPVLGVASSTSESITGTGGAGFLQIANQSAAPSTPTSATRIYADSSNRLSWKGTNGFVRTFDGTANTADRVYVLPDIAGTVVVSNGNVATVGSATLTLGSAKAPTISNTLTFAGTDGTTLTFQGTDTYVGRTTLDTLTNKTLTSPSISTPNIVGGNHTGITSFGVRSTGTGAFDLTLANTENLTAGRTLTIKVGDAARTLDLAGGNLALGATLTTGANSLTLNTTGVTNITLPTTGTLAITAGTTTNDNASAGNVGEYFETTSGAGNANATVTMTIATPCVVTWTAHKLTVGAATTAIKFTTTGALPTGITSATTYYAKAIDANTFNIASSADNALAGTFIATSGSQSGTHTGDIRVAMVSGGGANTQNIAAVSLGAGDWDVGGQMLKANVTSATTVTYYAGGLSLTSATVDRTFGRRLSLQYGGIALGSTEFTVFDLAPARFSLASTTTIYLVADDSFATAGVNCSGWIRARRVR